MRSGELTGELGLNPAASFTCAPACWVTWGNSWNPQASWISPKFAEGTK